MTCYFLDVQDLVQHAQGLRMTTLHFYLVCKFLPGHKESRKKSLASSVLCQWSQQHTLGDLPVSSGKKSSQVHLLHVKRGHVQCKCMASVLKHMGERTLLFLQSESEDQN